MARGNVDFPLFLGALQDLFSGQGNHALLGLGGRARYIAQHAKPDHQTDYGTLGYFHYGLRAECMILFSITWAPRQLLASPRPQRRCAPSWRLRDGGIDRRRSKRWRPSRACMPASPPPGKIPCPALSSQPVLDPLSTPATRSKAAPCSDSLS